MSKLCERREVIFLSPRSLQINTIGTRVFFTIVRSAPRPPLSPAPTPSASSITINVFFGAWTKLCVFFKSISEWLMPCWCCERSASSASIDVLQRVSDAFNSRTSKLSCLAMILTALVLPIPGGPLIRHERELGSFIGLFFSRVC